MTETLARTPSAKAPPAMGLVLVALGVVYLVWGSTYLGIRIVVEEAPPLVSGGMRFFTAGVLLAVLLAVRGVFGGSG